MAHYLLPQLLIHNVVPPTVHVRCIFQAAFHHLFCYRTLRHACFHACYRRHYATPDAYLRLSTACRGAAFPPAPITAMPGACPHRLPDYWLRRNNPNVFHSAADSCVCSTAHDTVAALYSTWLFCNGLPPAHAPPPPACRMPPAGTPGVASNASGLLRILLRTLLPGYARAPVTLRCLSVAACFRMVLVSRLQLLA